MIEVDNLSKRYGTFDAVSRLSFQVAPGELLGLVGPNGAGKTTTLRCLAGILQPSGGTIRISGHDLSNDPVPAKRGMAFFPDEPRLFDYLTVRQHLDFTARIYGVPDAPSRYAALLDQLELSGKADSLPGDLSRGMKQKVQIACGLLHSPSAILFDEPLTGLDPLAIRQMKEMIRRVAAEGASVILSSHLLHLVEELCPRILILKGGIKVAHGTVNDIRQQFALDDTSADLEEVFIRIAMTDTSPAVPPIQPPLTPTPRPPSS